MGKFNTFYQQICELKDKHPEVAISSYAGANLKVLKRFCDWLDKPTTYYSSDEFNLLTQAQEARKAFRVQPTPEHAKTLMAAIGVKLQHDANQRALDELKREILPGLKEAIWRDDDERKVEVKEEKTEAEIRRIELQWERHKHFAGLSTNALEEMIIKMSELDQYMGVLNRDITDRSGVIPKEMKMELAALAEEFYKLMESARQELIDAVLARLVLLPADVRHEVGLPGSRSIPADQRFETNVIAPVLASLVQAGLDKTYVDAFIRYTATQSTFTKSQIASFYQFVSSHGNAEQKKLLEKLFESTHEKQTEFATFPEKSDALPPPVDLPIGEKGKDKQLDAIETKYAELAGKSVDAKVVATLFNDAKMHELDVINPFGRGVAFVQAAPVLTPALSESDTETSEESQVSEALEKPKATHFSMSDKDKKAAMRDSLAFISRYVESDFEKSGRHTRQGRAQHLKEFISLSVQSFQEEPLDKRREEKYCMLVTSLFMHYLSIRDVKSELSIQLEKSLIHLLGVPRMDMEVILAYRKAVALRGEAAPSTSAVPKLFNQALNLFQSQTPDTKTDDPVCLFLKDTVIRYLPGVRDMMFDQSGQFNEKTRQLIEVFKQKDYQESRYFGYEGASKADFDSMIKPTRELKKK